MQFDDYDPYARLPEVDSFMVASDDMDDRLPLKLPHRSAEVGGQDASPHLTWSGFPEETRSFAVTCFDPDAPTGSGFWHWAVFNLPPTVTELVTDAGRSQSTLPGGASMLPNELRGRAYTGANPPEGTGRHRYFFVVHAVDVERLDLDPESTPAVLGFNLNFHALARAIIVPTAEYGEE